MEAGVLGVPSPPDPSGNTSACSLPDRRTTARVKNNEHCEHISEKNDGDRRLRPNGMERCLEGLGAVRAGARWEVDGYVERSEQHLAGPAARPPSIRAL